jgi:hypothetical protein
MKKKLQAQKYSNTLLKQSSKSYVNTGFSSAERPRTFGALTSFKLSFVRSLV